jgi:hypothetical protein
MDIPLSFATLSLSVRLLHAFPANRWHSLRWQYPVATHLCHRRYHVQLRQTRSDLSFDMAVAARSQAVLRMQTGYVFRSLQKCLEEFCNEAKMIPVSFAVLGRPMKLPMSSFGLEPGSSVGCDTF